MADDRMTQGVSFEMADRKAAEVPHGQGRKFYLKNTHLFNHTDNLSK